MLGDFSSTCVNTHTPAHTHAQSPPGPAAAGTCYDFPRAGGENNAPLSITELNRIVTDRGSYGSTALCCGINSNRIIKSTKWTTVGL